MNLNQFINYEIQVNNQDIRAKFSLKYKSISFKIS